MERAGGRLKWRSWVVLAALTKHSKTRREIREDDDEKLTETTADAETATRRSSESSASPSCTEKSVTEPCQETTWTPMGIREATTIIDPETSTTVTDLETTSIFPDMTTVITARDAEIMEDEEWAITSRVIVTESPAVLRQRRIERVRTLAAADSSPAVSSSLICSDCNSEVNSRFAALRAHFNNTFQAIPDHLSNVTSLLDGCCRRATDRSA